MKSGATSLTKRARGIAGRLRHLRIGMSCIALGRVLRGGELIVAQLANHLCERGHDVTVYQSGPPLPDARFRTVVVPVPYEFYDLEAPPLQLSLPSIRGRLRRYQALLCIAGFCTTVHADALKQRYDVFVLQHPQVEARLQRLLQRVGNTRTVALGNGPLLADALMVCGGIDAFIATSPVQAAWARYFRSAPVTLLPMGVDLTKFTPQGPLADDILHLPSPRILTCGALIPLKRVQLAMRAVAQLPKGSLVVIGDGPERAALVAQAQEMLPGRVLFTGMVSHAELPRYYRAGAALAFPSTSAETSGQVVLEAMACGTPVVATDDSTRRWLIGQGGRTVAVQDVQTFSHALHEVASGDLRHKARLQAERCGWDRIAHAFERLCWDLCQGHGPRQGYGMDAPPRPVSLEECTP